MAGSFDSASTEYINLSTHSASLQTTQGSISLWFKIPNTGINAAVGAGDSSGTAGSALFVGGNISSSYPDESLAWFGDGPVLRMYVRNGLDFYNDDEWHNFIVVADAIDNRIYVDGVKESITFGNGGATTSNGLLTDSPFNAVYLGLRQNASLPINGELDDVRIYDSNKYISDAEAKIIYESRGSDGITTVLKARYLMREQGNGSTMTSSIDYSVNGYNGTPTNTPTIEASPVRTG